jgi:hypothetical protein
MAKAGDLFKKILTKSGRYKSEKHDVLIEALNGHEMDDEDATLTVNLLMTRQEAETALGKQLQDELSNKFKGVGKAEAYDGIDKGVLATYEHILDEANLAKYKALTSTPEKAKFILGHLESRSAANSDSEAYKKALTDFKAKVESDYVPKTEKEDLIQKLSNMQKSVFVDKVVVAAATHQRISNTKKGEAKFNRNVSLDVQDLLDTKGWVYDFENGKFVTKGENATTVLAEGTDQPLQIANVLDLMLAENPEYVAVSDGGNTSGTVTVPTQTPATETKGNPRLIAQAQKSLGIEVK